MKKHPIISSVLLLALFLGVLTPQFAQDASTVPGKPDKEKHNHALLDEPSALGFFRTCNLVQSLAKVRTGSYSSREDMLIAVASHKAHFPPGSPGYGWMSVLRPAAVEPIPGWTLDLDWSADSFVLVLRSEQLTLISDQASAIYRAPTPAVAPKASQLHRAKDFPGAVGMGEEPLAAAPQPR